MGPLHSACLYCPNKFEIIESIIRAFPEALVLPVNAKGKWNGSFPLHILVSSNPSIASVKLLIDKRPEVLVKGDFRGSTPLSVAVRNRAQFHIIQYLVNMNKSVIFLSDKRMNVPLHVGCAWGPASLSTIKLLVEESRETLSFINADGKTPLDLAQSFSTQSPLQDTLVDYLQKAAYDIGITSSKIMDVDSLQKSMLDSTKSSKTEKTFISRCA